MRALGFDVKKAEVLKILKEYDKNGNGLIEFDDFNRVSKFDGFQKDYNGK
jgi:centrin-3